MTKKDSQLNCWDFWKCQEKDKKNCLVYNSKAGQLCWYYFDVNKQCCKAIKEKKIDECINCPFFKENFKNF